MKKKYITMITAALCISLLTGCEETPEEVIVKEKGAENIAEYESGEAAENLLRETLGAPEHYTNEASYEDGKLVIDTDADVIIPEVNSMDTISVTSKEMTQDVIDTITKAFFDGDKIYNGWSYNIITKEWIQEKLTLLKKYRSEGNMDPYGYGEDENGNLWYDIDAQIEKYENDLQTAPDEIVKEEVTPSFGLEYPEGKAGGVVVLEDEFYGVAETENGNYSYEIGDRGSGIVIQIDKQRDDLDKEMFFSWMEGEHLRTPGSESYVSEDTMKELAAISYEDAEKMAKERIEKLGWGMELYGWDYALLSYGEYGENQKNATLQDTLIDGGYMFYFSRNINGSPITYTMEYGGGVESMESTIEPWGYEICKIIITEDGIQTVEIQCPYEIGEVQTENVKLLDFDSIIQIYEQMMEVSNAGNAQYEEQRTYHITRITLGYSRIYNPQTDNNSGLLVPVWDFFGGFDIEANGYSEKNAGTYSTRSFMTINAIDGTVIDRDLGY